jgi:rhamnulokinase
VRCVLESIALKHQQALELLREAAGARPSSVHIVGGGSRNDLLCQMTADATELPVLAGPAEATEVGNLLVQAMALGEIGSLDQAREVVRSSLRPTVYEPSESTAWREARQRLQGIAAVARAPKAEVGA